MIEGWRADGDSGAAPALVSVKPPLNAATATSESRTLRMDFSLGVVVGERKAPHSQQAPMPTMFQEDYTNSTELHVGSAFMSGSCGTAG
jgi:hypothetical protein